MKKILLLLISLLFIPFIVFADDTNSYYEIKSIELLEKSDNTEIVSPANTDGNAINVNLKFYKISDYAKYKIVITNKTDKELAFDGDSLNPNIDYIGYELTYEDDNAIIKPNKDKEITINFYYKTSAPSELFRSNLYDASDNLSIGLTDNFIDVPNTLKTIGLIGFIGILIVNILIVIGILLITSNKKSSKMQVLLFILVLMLIPSISKAATMFTIPIKTNIVIQKAKPIPCTYEGELVQGATYTRENGKYTYKYKQEFNGTSWDNISTDGWGVALLDNTYTGSIDEELCSFINDKPITSMKLMFYKSKASSIDLSSFVTSNVTNMERMFLEVENVESYDLSSFDTSNVYNMQYMFNKNNSLKSIDLRPFDTSKVGYFEYMLANNPSLENVNISNFNVNGLTSYRMKALFSGNTHMKKIIMDNWDLSQYSTRSHYYNYIFQGLNSLDELSMKGWVIPEDFSYSNDNLNLASTNVKKMDVSNWDLSKNIGSFFRSNHSLEEVVGLDTWDISNLTSLYALFQECYNLKKLNISNWDGPNVTDIGYLLKDAGKSATSVDYNIENVKLPSVIYAADFFKEVGYNAPTVKINIDDFDLSALVNQYDNFRYIGQNSQKVDITINKLNLNSINNLNEIFFGTGSRAN